MHDAARWTEPCCYCDDELSSPVEVFEPSAAAPVLIVCDHASNRVPDGLGALGLPPEALDRHIAWDIGAAAVSRRLAGYLGATAVLSTISRLVIDCNRPLGHPTSICTMSDGTNVPGNQGLDETARLARAAAYYHPYHAAIGEHLARLEADGRTATILAIHSFTPVLDGRQRPWQAGILWNRDPRLAVPLIEALSRQPGLCVGDNEPYSGRTCNHTVDVHGDAHGRPHVAIEIRQDQIANTAGVMQWAALLASLLAPLLATADCRCRQRY